MLTLQDDATLNTEEIWLKKVYSNILMNLIQATITSNTSSEFDPFMSKYVGINSVKYNKFEYQALLEVTSYFWASKGGRGILLEKIFTSLGGPHAMSNKTLSKIVSQIELKRALHQGNYTEPQGLIKSTIKKLKFDLVNVINDNLIILELKNRVDSGGSGAREEALSKKFFAICKSIEDGEKIFEYQGREYDFAEMLSLFGIKKVEMYLGLLYNINGKEATLIDDKSKGGFHSSSKTCMENYAESKHLSIKVNFNPENLSIFFQKGSLLVSISMLYGNEVIQKFTTKQLTLNSIMNKVFANSWDDIWLTCNLAISQRALLLEYNKNHITEIKKLIDNDQGFTTTYSKFRNNPSDLKTLRDIIDNIQTKADFSNLPLMSNQEGHLADCLYLLTAYLMIGSKSKKRGSTKDDLGVFMDINKQGLSLG